MRGDMKNNTSASSKAMEYAGGFATSGAGCSGTSIFDPVLCELAYRWFCPAGGAVLDPFAGGSVRGIVAAKLGLAYTGIELRKEQVQANQLQGIELCENDAYPPVWINADSRNVINVVPEGFEADLVFSCPPYADLEVYSDDPQDLSTLSYDDFIKDYRLIIKRSISLLKPDRFACFVVGDIRDRQGFYRGFVSDTIAAFQDCGAKLYNEAILITQAGSLPLRVQGQFKGYRKLGKAHQNVLVFYNGNPKCIPDIFGSIKVDNSIFENDDSTNDRQLSLMDGLFGEADDEV
jgi:DNA modification methylase